MPETAELRGGETPPPTTDSEIVDHHADADAGAEPFRSRSTDMNREWTRRSTLSPEEIEVLAGLDFDPAPSVSGATGGRGAPDGRWQGDDGPGPVVRWSGWLESAYPHLGPHDRRIRATAVAVATVFAIVAITLVVFPVMASTSSPR